MFGWLRILIGCTGLLIIAIGMPVDYFLTVVLPGRKKDQRARARLLHRWATVTTRAARCRIRFSGNIPRHGLCVSNHLSYLDIPVFGTIAGMSFVSKHDVLRWPLFGRWAVMCGTLFIKREKKGDVATVGDQMAEVLKTGVPLVVFPEGTSSGGETILPFKSSLFQPAVDHQWPVTPMWIGYELPGGSVVDEVAYWRDMTLLPHLLNLFSKKGLCAVVAFGEPIESGSDRKDLCRRAHAAVEALRAAERGSVAGRRRD